MNFIEIYGFHAVKAALKNTKRNHQNIIISENLKEKFKKIELKVNKVNYIPNDKINKTYGNEKSHQGIILKTSKLKQPSIEDVLYNSKNKKSELMIMLDHVSDPQNIGSIMRSCALFNCSSIIISKNNAPDVTSSMAKAASGALEIVNYIRVTNLDSSNSVNVNLQIDVTESGSGASAANETATILLAAGESFVMGTPHDSIAAYDADASVQTTLHDLESILIDPSANEVKLEVIAAST